MPQRRTARTIASAAVILLSASAGLASDGLRVATWNITDYSGGRIPAIQTATYGEYEGRQFAPDVIMLQEVTSATALSTFVTALNTAPGSPADWAAAPFARAPGSAYDNAVVYRTSRVDLVGTTLVLQGGLSPLPPRNITRFDVRAKGYASEAATLALYSSHMKSGSSASDLNRRILEAQTVRDDIAALPAGRHAVFAGDTNIPSAFGTDYQTLVNAGPGRLFDPISRPGSWQNSATYRFIHTQDPAGGGGMDDRFDQMLLTASLLDDQGMDYIGDYPTPWDLSTWNDPAHSYRCWGNDGNSYNLTLNTSANDMVGPAIAQALVTVAANLGHLPVYVDMLVPAKVLVSDETIDLGDVPADTPAEALVEIAHGGDVSLWGPNGIDALDVALSTTANLTADETALTLAPGASQVLLLTLDGGPAGSTLSGTLTVASDDPDRPQVLVTITANAVAAGCGPADLNNDGILDFGDVGSFVTAFSAGDLAADLNGDGLLDFGDVGAFVAAFNAGC